MEAQLEATNRLIGLLEKQPSIIQGETASHRDRKPVDKTLIEQQPQLARAVTWLRAYPNLQGLSLRKAAAAAGVSVNTLQRAMAEVKNQSQAVQERLL